MKALSILFALIYCLNTMAVAPLGVKGQNQTSNLYPYILQAPNNLVTDLGSGQALIESGNNNILSNPGFEHSTASTGWTLSAGSSAAESTVVVQGKKSLKITLSAQTLAITQDSTLNQAQFADGVQGIAWIRVKTSLSGISVCARKAGSTVTSLCVSVLNSNTWGLYKVPFVMGGTSNGIAIISSGNVTGDVYVDDAFVGIERILDVQPVIGPWTAYTPTFTGYGTPTSVEFFYRINGNNLDIRGKFVTGTVTAVEARISLPTGYTSLSSTYIPSLVAVGQFQRLAATSANGGVVLIEPSVQYMTFGLYTNSNNPSTKVTASTAFNSSEGHWIYASIPVVELAGNASIYNQSCNSDIECTNDFSATVTSGGTVGAENGDWINGNASIASTSQYTITFNSNVFGAAPNCTAIVNQPNPYIAFIQTAATTSSVVIRTYNPFGGADAAAAFIVKCSRSSTDYKGRRSIVGSFQNIPTTIGSNGADIQTVYFGTGANCSSNCTTGTCTICTQVGNKITSVTFQATGTYRLNGIDGTKYICTGGGYSGSYLPIAHDKSSSTSTYAQIISGTGSTATNTGNATVTCIGVP